VYRLLGKVGSHTDDDDSVEDLLNEQSAADFTDVETLRRVSSLHKLDTVAEDLNTLDVPPPPTNVDSRVRFHNTPDHVDDNGHGVFHK